jgi:hypothetical protein
MDNEELKAAELRGYSKGYAAGKRRKQSQINRESRQRKEDAFWQRAFLAALPAAFAAQNWTRGDKPINKLDQRVLLAAETADEALKHALLHL